MTRVWVRESAGWLAATAIALVTTAAVASSGRSELLLRDGDSLIVALFARSFLSGAHLDWAMSSVLFVPESAALIALDAVLPIGVDGLLLVSAVTNLLSLYGAIRLVAGRTRSGAAPVTWAVVAFAVFSVLAMAETSASRDALELASLQLTTTYYSATVVAAVLTVGLIRRMLDRPTTGILLLIALALVAALSAFSNPLFAVWATVPLSVLLVIGAVRASARTRTRTLLALAVLVAATAVGLVARIPFGEWIANTGAGYAQPALWQESVAYYAELVAERMLSPLGLASLVLVLGLLVLAAIRSLRATDPGTRLVASAAWVIPLLVGIGAIALGTHAARYLQPLAFAPVLALVASPRIPRLPQRMNLSARAVRRSAAVIVVVLLVAGGVSIPRLVSVSQATDADLRCATSWIEASGRTGAGQFWTVRLPKLHLADPSQLVQVDHRLNGYAWLVNRTDFAADEVTFLIEDAQTVLWELPRSQAPEDVIDCGRYSILDFGGDPLPIGSPHS